MTRSQFLTAYETELKARYSWTSDAPKLARFLEGVAMTLNGGSMWCHDGEAVTAAWRFIGGKGKPTLKALRALPA